MNHSLPSVSRSRRWRRWILSAIAAGAGGTTLVIIFHHTEIIESEIY